MRPQNSHDRLINILDNFDFKVQDLVERKEWGSMNFKNQKKNISLGISLIENLKNLPLDRLLEPTLKEIVDSLDALGEVYGRIKTFNLEFADPKEIKRSLELDLYDKTIKFVNITAKWIPFLTLEQGNLLQDIEIAEQKARDLDKLIKKYNLKFEKIGLEYAETLKAARETAVGAGAAIFSDEFKIASGEFKGDAKIWLKVTAGLGIVSLLVAVYMWFCPGEVSGTGAIIQKLGTKFVILGTLISATFWCGRIYKALMHQAYINNHRALSIQTVKAFKAAAEDIQIKDAVVLEAARSIFGNVSTGFIDTQNNSEGDMKIMEIAKKIMPSS